MYCAHVGTERLDLLVDADELARRRAAWSPPEPRYTGGVAKYAGGSRRHSAAVVDISLMI